MPHDKDNMLFTEGGDDSDVDNGPASGDSVEESGMFFIGDITHASDEEEEPDEPPILWMALTPPGDSSLAKRRLAKSNSQEQNDAVPKTPAEIQDNSPLKVPSAAF